MNELQQKTVQAIVNVFETGRVRGLYSSLSVIKGDSGHLSYGRSQAALGSGALFQLLDSYCQQSNARFADQLRPALARFDRKDISLDHDAEVRRLLENAGNEDPVMRETQDQFFNRRYFVPALHAAERLGIQDALGQAVVYDSHIQGGWPRVSGRVGPVIAGDARGWIKKYVNTRAEWLKSLKPPLPGTVYRMSSFSALIAHNNWDLALPLDVRGVRITEAALNEDQPLPGSTKRTLTLTRPRLRGEDVRALQTALHAKQFPAAIDGVYGPFTDQLVREWQAQRSMQEQGVGALTRASLNL